MIEKELEITNKLGLHARAASKLAALAGRHSSVIGIVKDGKRIDAKSIMALMLLAAAKGTRLTITCDGTDEDVAMNAIETLFAERFDESE